MIAFIIETCFLQILRFIWLSTHWSVTKCVKISFNVKGMGFTRKSKVYLGLEKIAPSANSSTDIQKQIINFGFQRPRLNEIYKPPMNNVINSFSITWFTQHDVFFCRINTHQRIEIKLVVRFWFETACRKICRPRYKI